MEGEGCKEHDGGFWPHSESDIRASKRIVELNAEVAVLKEKNGDLLDRNVELISEIAAFKKLNWIPEGARRVEAYVMDGRLIVLGIPFGDEHNCDAMGCRQAHVIHRIKLSEIKEDVDGI